MGRALTLRGKLSGRASCVLAKQLYQPSEQVPLEEPLAYLIWRGLATGRDLLTWGSRNTHLRRGVDAR